MNISPAITETENAQIFPEKPSEVRFKKYNKEFEQNKKNIPTGKKNAKEINSNIARIKTALKCSDDEWNNWRWQIQNRIEDVETLSKILTLSNEEKISLTKVAREFRWGFSPYYASLMNKNDPNCPIRRQMIPDILELEKKGIADFSAEEVNSPVPNLVRWYTDRVVINTTNICSSFCRHCLRRRHIGETDKPAPEKNLVEAFAYIKEHKEIRDVLFTGGDPLTYSDDKIDWMLSELHKIKHIEIKRIGSRMPVTVPQRITDKLCKIFEKYHPFYLNMQFNHPLEITKDAELACKKIVSAGVPLGNQSVLMKGINDDKFVYKVLCHELMKIRVRPYYLYHCQGTIGIQHLRTPIEKGLEIIESLRGHTTGMAVPDFIITPPGLGKTPLAPQYHVSSGDGYVILRNWEGKLYRYENPKLINSK